MTGNCAAVKRCVIIGCENKSMVFAAGVKGFTERAKIFLYKPDCYTLR